MNKPHFIAHCRQQLLPFLVLASILFLSHSSWSEQSSSSNQSRPDIQGTWYFGTGTPLTRAPDLGDQLHFSEAEAKIQLAKLIEQQQKTIAPIDPNLGAPETGGSIGYQADFNFALARTELTTINGQVRTSLVVDPANGQLPIRKDYVDYRAQRKKQFGVTNVYDNPESMGMGERCLPTGPLPNLYPLPWNANLQIVQTNHFIVIAAESSAPARIIRLNSQHRNNGLRNWLGDSIAWWEGQTLVIHTKDFHLQQTSNFPFPMSEDFELFERITPIDDEKMLYAYTIKDLKVYSADVTVETLLKRRPPHERIFEVACHEGNYSKAFLLAGARYEDKHPKAKPKNPELPASVLELLTGTWQGKVNGTQLNFKFESQASNTILALLDLPSYGLMDVAVRNLKVDKSNISFDVPDIGSKFEGTLQQGKINGDWSREDQSNPLELSRQ